MVVCYNMGLNAHYHPAVYVLISVHYYPAIYGYLCFDECDCAMMAA